MKCNQICKWNSNVGCVKPYGVPCILENVSATDRKATNADRIRAMNDEELCKFLGECKFCDICEEGCDSCTYNGDCDKRLLEWLKQPAEEGGCG